MTTEIKNTCPPWEDDPGKFYLTLQSLSIRNSGQIAAGAFPVGRKMHVTNLHLLCKTNFGAVGTTNGIIGLYKTTTTGTSITCSITGTNHTGTVRGDIISGTETEIEFLKLKI